MKVETAGPSVFAAAREVFVQCGYAEAEFQEIAARAEISPSELERLFPGGKEELFRAVALRLTAQLALTVRTAARSAAGPWEALERGIAAFLDASATDEVRRILLHDGHIVLGPEAWRAVEGEYAIGLVQRALEAAVEAGQLPSQPTRAAAYVVVGALEEAAMTIAAADDAPAAREEMGRTLGRLLSGLRAPTR